MPAPIFANRFAFLDETFTDLELTAADFSGREFERCTFVRCKLPESRWTNAKLEQCRFDGCDLSRIVPRGAALVGVEFVNSRVMGVDWVQLGLVTTMSFDGCDLRYASFVKLKLPKIRIANCVARDASFVDTDLTAADFSDTDLTGATFQGCLLLKSDLSQANGFLIDPTANRVKGARVSIDAAIAFLQTFGVSVDG